MTDTLESYQQAYTYDTGSNLTILSHRAQSSTWQQTINLHPNNNRGIETQLSTTDFDANGNLLILNNIATLGWHYNNTLNKLNKLTKDDKTTEYYVYDHQGNRVRTVLESSQQIQSQRDYLPSIDISINEKNQATNTLHIGTHVFTETTKDNTQTRYQLSNHLQSNTLELNDKAEVISYEHFYPYGGTTIIAGKDQTQVQQKRYRYTGKERDDSSGLSYYGARYLAPWMARWISPDSAGAVDGLNLYVYVRNNPLKYVDPTGHIKTIAWEKFTSVLNEYQEDLNLWIGENHYSVEGRNLLLKLDQSVSIPNFVREACESYSRPDKKQVNDMNWYMPMAREYIAQRTEVSKSKVNISETMRLANAIKNTRLLFETHNSHFIGIENWSLPFADYVIAKYGHKLVGKTEFLVGSAHLLCNKKHENFPDADKTAYPVHQEIASKEDNIVLIPYREIINHINGDSENRTNAIQPEFGFWVRGKNNSIEETSLVFGREGLMKRMFGDAVEPIPVMLSTLSLPVGESGLTMHSGSGAPPSKRQRTS